MRNTFVTYILACKLLFLASVLRAEQPPEFTWPKGSADTWHGFKRHTFTVDGCPAWVVEPKKPLLGKPWSWCMEFPDAFTDRCAAPALLDKGFYHVHIAVGDTTAYNGGWTYVFISLCEMRLWFSA